MSKKYLTSNRELIQFRHNEIRKTVTLSSAGIMIVVLLGSLLFSILGLRPANAVTPGSSPNSPINVKSPSDVPAKAVQTGSTKNSCATTTTWKLVTPAVEGTSKEEFRYLREIPAQDEQSHSEWSVEKRTRDFHPAVEEKSHTEYKYARTVDEYKTENKYMYRKWVKGNVETQNKKGGWDVTGSFDYELYSPSNGWNGELHHEGQWGQESDTDGTGGHNDTSKVVDGKRKHSTNYLYKKSELIDTRQVKTGSHTETTDWVTEKPAGDGWKQTDSRKVVDQKAQDAFYGDWSDWKTTDDHLKSDPTLPKNTDTAEYRKNGPTKVVDSEAVPGYTEYYVLGGKPSRDRSEASWISKDQAPEGWTQFDSRTVQVSAGTPGDVTYYAYNDGVKCVTPPTPKPPVKKPETPKKTTTVKKSTPPTIINGGL